MNTKALAMEPEESALNELQDRSWCWHRDAAIALLLAVLAFAVRLNHVDFNSLSEDESAKWAAIQEYRHGHFVGVNSEHPMMLKVLAWGSLAAGEHWNRLASLHGWPAMSPEGWLRFPNVLLGAATAAILFLFCRRLMEVVGSFAAGFFWAVSPLAVALNRLAKEETPLTFFTLLACYFYCRAQQADSGESARRWYDLSAIGFGLAFASQYILHLLGLNALAWLLAGKMGLTRNPLRFRYGRFFLVICLTFILVNPVVLFPSNFSAILHWLHHDGVVHSGYDFDGTLYLNFPSRLLAGVPWTFYFWLLLIKTPIPILVAVIAGSIVLLRERRTFASCFFLVLGVLQLAGLSVSGAKWVRYSLPMLPFLFLAGGYAVQATWDRVRETKMSLAFVALASATLFAVPLLELHTWSPYYSFYLNAIGGGQKNIARYFGQDEVSEFDTREVAQQICSSAHAGTRLATARPMSMAYYVENCGRTDIEVVPLYDSHYVPREGDMIVLEPSRRFFETQRFFDVLGKSDMSHREVRVGPLLASTIYLFDRSTPQTTGQEQWTLTELRKSPSELETKTHKPDFATMNTVVAFLRLPWRNK
ncbi:MAG TPA: glycosyltransferase family 39 protein [Terriglobales bacterium]|nr:glycosyltransferase family 39 protein [Terriglobales bacterium]